MREMQTASGRGPLDGLLKLERPMKQTAARKPAKALTPAPTGVRKRASLQGGRAAYGKQILATVSQDLTAEFRGGFSYPALTRMVRFGVRETAVLSRGEVT